MSVSFKDYLSLASSIPEESDQLDEAFFSAWAKNLYDLATKKLGAKASKEEIEQEIERLKKLNKADLQKIAKTKQSRDFHDRKSKEIASRAAKSTQGTRATISTSQASDRKTAAVGRAVDREWRQQIAGMYDSIEPKDSALVEAKEFIVTYKLKSGDKEFKWTTAGRDSHDAKRKFGETHYGAKLLSIRPKPKTTAKAIQVEPTLDDENDE